ncbi:MAG: apolipoprotein N-acyltransferase [Candidatus Eremiobacteraeota bacterium]|nr:apolipoprotein N-acyltransferase [Candidatus Eremiobacteraeota bacterium]
MISTASPRDVGVVTPREHSGFWRYALPASLLSPLLLSLAYPKTNVAWFAFFALVPLFLLWARASWKQALFCGWLAGTIMFMLLFRWMTHSIGDFVGNWSWLALFLMSAIEGFSLAVVAVVTALVGRGSFRAAAVFAAPAAWLLVEMVRTRGSLGVPFGELGAVAAHLPWLLPIAAFAGVYGLTAIIALCNGALAGIIGGTPAARATGTITLLALVLLIAAGDFARSHVVVAQPTVPVAVAQGNISQRVKWSPQIFSQTISIYADLTRQAAARGARVVVWPETAITSFPLQNPELLGALQSLAHDSGVWIIAGTVDRPANDRYYNTMLDLTPQGRVGGVYHKVWLVPFAEYLPLDQYLRGLPLMDNISRFARGPGPHLLSAAQLQWGILVCYESAFAPYARQTANAGADALIVATDDAWFGTSAGPYEHADAARIDAVQTGRWIVRGADTGISQIIDPKGDIVQSLPLDRMGIIVANVGTGVTTPYDRFGVFWLVVLAVLALLAGLIPRPSSAAGWRSKRGQK